MNTGFGSCFSNLNFLVLFWYPFWSYLGLPGFVPVPGPGNPLSFDPKEDDPKSYGISLLLMIYLRLSLSKAVLPSKGIILHQRLSSIKMHARLFGLNVRC